MIQVFRTFIPLNGEYHKVESAGKAISFYFQSPVMSEELSGSKTRIQVLG